MVTFIKIAREYWNIKCDLHLKLDVILDEDHYKSRVGDSINIYHQSEKLYLI